MLIGRLVRLRAVEPTDYPVLARWLNDPEIMMHWGRPGNTESVAEIARVEQDNALRNNSRKYIIETYEAESIGQVDYYDLEWANRSAWTSIMIGNKDFWGGGYGTDAMTTLLKHLFGNLGLHRVALTVHAGNERAQRSYKKNGFIVEGTLREWHYFDGRWENGVYMAVLSQDFPFLARR